MKTNVLIHEGVALKMDWVEKLSECKYCAGFTSGCESCAWIDVEYNTSILLAKERAIKERIEYEDQNFVKGSIDIYLPNKDQTIHDGIYVVDLPETEIIGQFKQTSSSKWIDNLSNRKVVRFKKEEDIGYGVRGKLTKEEARTATDCKCGSASSGWTQVRCCNLCGKSVETFWKVSANDYAPYQLCPKCNGEGFAWGLNQTTFSSSVKPKCNICNGAGVIATKCHINKSNA